MTAHDHRRPCARCGHDERSHDTDGRCSVMLDSLMWTANPFCWCDGYRAASDEQPAEADR